MSKINPPENGAGEELTLDIIKSKAVKGVIVLTGRTFILQLINLLSIFLLTIFLSPSDYGVFFIISAIINLFAYFSDIGLAAALIQKKEKPTEKELRTTFTVQQILVGALILIIFFLTPVIQRIYHLSVSGVYLLWALALSLLFSSLKTIPSVILERKLDFNKLVIPQILETIVFNLVAVILAWRGFGVSSFTFAVVLRGVVGLVAIYLLQPWNLVIAFERASLKSLLRYGVAYQANTFLAVIKDDGLIAFLGGIMGSFGIGLLGWAQKWAYSPLRFFMDQIIKVTFPAYSRMQDDKRELSNAVFHSVFFVCLLVFPSLVGLNVVAPMLVEIIPKYEKWQPALLALGLLSVNAGWAAVATPLTNLFNAIGKIDLTFKLMIIWTTLSWILIPLLSTQYGVNGAAFGFLIVGLSSILPIWISKKYVKFDLLGSVGKPLISSITMGFILSYIKSYHLPSLLWIFTLIFIGVVTYLGFMWLLMGKSLSRDARKIFYEVWPSRQR